MFSSSFEGTKEMPLLKTVQPNTEIKPRRFSTQSETPKYTHTHTVAKETERLGFAFPAKSKY